MKIILQYLRSGQLPVMNRETRTKMQEEMEYYGLVITICRGHCAVTLTGHTDSVWIVTALSNGQLASGSGDNTIKIWTADGRCTATLTGHTHSVMSVIELSNGQLASSSWDKTIKIWELTAA